MAFDTTTRNELQKLVGRARDLLVEEFTSQCQGVYGIQPDGSALDISSLGHLSEEDRNRAELLRDRVNHLASSIAGSRKYADAVARMVREQAFTVLNRLCALRMCEERELVQECVFNGYESKGFRLYDQAAAKRGGDTYSRYSLFLQLLFDELAVDLGVLFDRFSLYGLLFPRENALKELLRVINTPALAHIWAEDESIGWVYQYFNSEEERREMRRAKSPRTSRELAVRNQFFTPRYVVEFLTDNTLGRIWYEMRKGETALTETCRYLARRQTEVFLKSDETRPASSEDEGTLSEEERLKLTVYITHRGKKDPRDLKVLDPACGSGHFLLYAFDLLEIIYREAWGDPDSPASEATGSSMRNDYATHDDLKTAVPELILRWNLHGVDIDPRAAQIAALSLWLRAQRSWRGQGVKAIGRPQVRKSNIICAEPMPGEKDLLQDFTSGLQPTVLGQLVEVVFNRMHFAGEAGSLLRIEKEIHAAIETARDQWLAGPKPEQEELFPETGYPKQGEMQFDFTGVTKESFWSKAEEKILKSLHDYADEAQEGEGLGRRLFSEDAAQGFAFIDICQQRFDAVLMNPPFGEATERSTKIIEKYFPAGKNDLFAAFVLAGVHWLKKGGLLGAITNRTGFFNVHLESWRLSLTKNDLNLRLLADLGSGVLDALVETAAYVISKGDAGKKQLHAIRLIGEMDREERLLSAIKGSDKKGQYISEIEDFSLIPNRAFVYWLQPELFFLLHNRSRVADDYVCTKGLTTDDDFRFVRAWWEVPLSEIGKNRTWVWYAKGGEYTPFFYDVHLVVLWRKNGLQMAASAECRNANVARTRQSSGYYFLPAVAFSQRTSMPLSARILPSGCAFGAKTVVCIPRIEGLGSITGLVAFLNSGIGERLTGAFTSAADTAARSYESGTTGKLPYNDKLTGVAAIQELVEDAWRHIWVFHSTLETSAYFRGPFANRNNLIGDIRRIIDEIDSAVFKVYGMSRDAKVIHWQLAETVVNEREVWNEARSMVSIGIGLAFGRWSPMDLAEYRDNQRSPSPFDKIPQPLCDGNEIQGGEKKPDVLANDRSLTNKDAAEKDLLNRLRYGLRQLSEEGLEESEAVWCDDLGVASIRDYIDKERGFFQDHLKTYSKSRRKAPIYWPLSTDSGNYTLWIYYPRLSDQTLYTCVNDFIDPKVKSIGLDLERLRSTEQVGQKQRNQLDGLVELERELKSMREELLRVAKLPYKPNQNDGVLITAAPLWRLFRHKSWQKALKKCWDELDAGKYDWAHLAYAIWPDRVREVCKKDKSIAIAHGLEDLYDE